MNRAERRAGLAFARTTRNEWHPFERVDGDAAWRAQHAARLRQHIAATGELIECWRNNVYAVMVYERARDGAPPAKHLAIRRHDAGEVRGWSDLQRIKNEIVGEDYVGLEVYPRESDLMNQANMRHIFVLPFGEAAPFTIQGRWS